MNHPPLAQRPAPARLTGLVALLALAACSEPSPPAAPPPPEVTIDRPERRAVTAYGEFTGNTRAIEFTEVRARATGRLEQMHFQPSSMVKSGDLLFTIEQAAYQAARDAAFADLESAKAELARAESDLKRVEQAIQTAAVSEQDRDLAQAKRDQASAAVLAAEAALDRAQLDLSYTEVRARIDGQVGRNLIDPGNLVSASSSTLLTTISKVDPIFVYFTVPEDMVLNWLRSRRDNRAQAEAVAHVATAADEGFPHEGRIDFVANTVDPATGTIEMRAVIPNPDLVLFPGLFVRVRVPGPTRPDTIVIDERAVASDLGGQYVYVVGEGNVVEQRYVTLGPVENDGTIPVFEGLEGDEMVIVEGLLKARPGLPVNPQAQAH